MYTILNRLSEYTYQKTWLHTLLCCLFLKSSKAFSVSLSVITFRSEMTVSIEEKLSWICTIFKRTRSLTMTLLYRNEHSSVGRELPEFMKLPTCLSKSYLRKSLQLLVRWILIFFFKSNMENLQLYLWKLFTFMVKNSQQCLKMLNMIWKLFLWFQINPLQANTRQLKIHLIEIKFECFLVKSNTWCFKESTIGHLRLFSTVMKTIMNSSNKTMKFLFLPWNYMASFCLICFWI